MLRRGLPLVFALATLTLDAADSRRLAFYVLLAAIPVAAASALDLFGQLVELPARAPGELLARLDAACAFVGLVLVVAAAASRAPAAVAPVGDSAVVGAAVLFAVCVAAGVARGVSGSEPLSAYARAGADAEPAAVR